MTQREIVVRICEAYIASGKTVNLEDIFKLADYIMLHTSDVNLVSSPWEYKPMTYYSTSDASSVSTAYSGTLDTSSQNEQI